MIYCSADSFVCKSKQLNNPFYLLMQIFYKILLKAALTKIIAGNTSNYILQIRRYTIMKCSTDIYFKSQESRLYQRVYIQMNTSLELSIWVKTALCFKIVKMCFAFGGYAPYLMGFCYAIVLWSTVKVFLALSGKLALELFNPAWSTLDAKMSAFWMVHQFLSNSIWARSLEETLY